MYHNLKSHVFYLPLIIVYRLEDLQWKDGVIATGNMTNVSYYFPSTLK